MPGNAPVDSCCNVIVRNLPFSVQEDTLANLFEDCGDIKKVKIMKNENGRSKGFGFVDFEDAESATKALAKNGTLIDGRDITVSYSNPRDGKGSFGGRGNDNGPRNRGGFGFSRQQNGNRNDSFKNSYGY